MTLPLHEDLLRATYAMLCECAPFNKWNLPDAEDVVFRVVRSKENQGWYMRRGGKHTIGVSSRLIGHTFSLIALMAHEMIHVHQDHAGMKPCSEHDAAFYVLAAQVCKVHGFDPKTF